MKVHRNGDITLTAQEAKIYFDFIYIAKTLIKNFKDDLQSIEDNLFQSILNRDHYEWIKQGRPKLR